MNAIAAREELSAFLERPAMVPPVVLAARACDLAGYRRIALFGAGRHSARYARQPWTTFDLRVVALVDDAAPAVRLPVPLRGLRVWTPADLLDACTSQNALAPVDAVVVSSDAHEATIVRRHSASFQRAGVPLMPIYAGSGTAGPAALVERLVRRWGLTSHDAVWLVTNRCERHDATLPMLPPERTELHLARYEFAAAVIESLNVSGATIVDAACGTGYGSAMLRRVLPGTKVVGVDVDARSIDYAHRRFGGECVGFVHAPAERTGLAEGCAAAVVSFETIEHVADTPALLAEFARLLRPGGRLILSTPNDGGLTAHHVHSFDRAGLSAAIARGGFGGAEWWGQCASSPLPERQRGNDPARATGSRVETLMAVARRE